MAFKHLAVLLTCMLAAAANAVPGAVESTTTPSVDSSTNELPESLTTPSADNSTIGLSEPQFSSTYRMVHDLYNLVAYESYDLAASRALDLMRNNRPDVIKSAVDLLIEHKRTFIAPFAYKLGAAGGEDIVKSQFPTAYKMVLSDHFFKLINYQDRCSFELGPTPDFANDKRLYGNNERPHSQNYHWKLEAVEDDGKIYFKIRHRLENRYLKLGNSMDRDGDYQAFASANSDSNRHLWSFQPVMYNGELLFFVINRAHYQALKLGRGVYHGNRNLFGQGGNFANHPELYGWTIKAFGDSSNFVIIRD
ncbi:microvitellogenin-like [Bombyx mandarina]|uniref:Microvitellogenin-like n=1 Tax=Bombyx mandarina TaxID=7092 RepID=A0A6J2KHU9_BOMMA|nr:microvitellogenin-like [Bombyx mandarina]